MTTIADARISGAPSQAVFDVLMRALSEPGTLRVLPAEVLATGIEPTLWPLLALSDVDVAINVDDDVAGEHSRLVSDATGAPTTELRAADMVALSSPLPTQIDHIRRGDAWHPELGARVVLAVRSLQTEPHVDALMLTLEGPGVNGSTEVYVGGLAEEIAERLGRASGTFPSGFDTWLVAADGALAGIPRSTKVTVSNISNTNEEGS